MRTPLRVVYNWSVAVRPPGVSSPGCPLRRKQRLQSGQNSQVSHRFRGSWGILRGHTWGCPRRHREKPWSERKRERSPLRCPRPPRPQDTARSPAAPPPHGNERLRRPSRTRRRTTPPSGCPKVRSDPAPARRPLRDRAATARHEGPTDLTRAARHSALTEQKPRNLTYHLILRSFPSSPHRPRPRPAPCPTSTTPPPRRCPVTTVNGPTTGGRPHPWQRTRRAGTMWPPRLRRPHMPFLARPPHPSRPSM